MIAHTLKDGGMVENHPCDFLVRLDNIRFYVCVKFLVMLSNSS